jgi:hypothetical protein
MIPEFDENGNLPPEVHICEWEEFKERFGYNRRRVLLMAGLELAMRELQAAGCSIIYIDGSFISSKPTPGDEYQLLKFRSSAYNLPRAERKRNEKT